MKIITVTPENVQDETLFCIKDITNPGFDAKKAWFKKRYAEGLRMKILKDTNDKMIGFIEFVPASNAWRPINADDFIFIHCMYVYSKKDRNQGYGSILIKEAEKEAKKRKMAGVCVMSSKGSWMADKTIFEKNGYKEIARRGRFELLSKKWIDEAADPQLYDWTLQKRKYQGWHLLYADQCPWHEKSVAALLDVAMDHGIDLKVKKITNAQEAKQAPSGFGVFSLLHNGKLLEDHYLSATRFKNILQKELQLIS
ncbi:GNAT family N-acetyltransferase [Sungkyunkwania multivorans]|uniref:GNAT family N-acetyltransferase n=1 Tax=Sungkyunkwania multivorans TaxID=1173618 RepID=A0ABW3D2U9_9FLAO